MIRLKSVDFEKSRDKNPVLSISTKIYGFEIFSSEDPTLKDRVGLNDVINFPSSFRISDSCFRDFRVS